MEAAVQAGLDWRELVYKIGRKETSVFETNNIAYAEELFMRNARRKLMIWIYCLLCNYGKITPIENLDKKEKEQMWRFVLDICNEHLVDKKIKTEMCRVFYTIEYFLNEKKIMKSNRYYEGLIGSKFGMLTIVGYAEPRVQSNGRNKIVAKCKCDCVNEKDILLTSVVNRTRSCGCIISRNHISHGMTHHRLYSIWANMMSRCENKNNERYKDYGGRGITVCKRWRDSEYFFKWALNNGYSENLTLERNNVNGNYSPFNCTWKTKKEQSRNTRNNIRIEINGVVKVLSEWCEYFDVNYKRVHARIKRGWVADINLFK